MPEKGEALPTPPPRGGILRKSGGDGSLTVAESSPNRKIGAQPQEIGVQLRPKPTGREESGVLLRANHQAPYSGGRDLPRRRGGG